MRDYQLFGAPVAGAVPACVAASRHGFLLAGLNVISSAAARAYLPTSDVYHVSLPFVVIGRRTGFDFKDGRLEALSGPLSGAPDAAPSGANDLFSSRAEEHQSQTEMVRDYLDFIRNIAKD